jgi:kelch-like protein 10
MLSDSYYYFRALTNAAYKYIIKEFMTIAEQSDELMKLRQEEFKQIIEDNQLNVKQEECVWDVLLKWVDKDPKNRKNDLLFLLPKVRFGLMDSKYFIDNVMIIIYLTVYKVVVLFMYVFAKLILTVSARKKLITKNFNF